MTAGGTSVILQQTGAGSPTPSIRLDAVVLQAASVVQLIADEIFIEGTNDVSAASKIVRFHTSRPLYMLTMLRIPHWLVMVDSIEYACCLMSLI